MISICLQCVIAFSAVYNSAIDFVFVNNLMYDKYINMHIDENKEKFDLSDHNMVSVYFNIFFGSPKLF